MILAEGRYLLVEVPVAEVFTSTLDNPEEKELLKKEGEACGQTVEKDCGQCGHDLYCSNINSPIRPKQCGKCLPKWTWKNANTDDEMAGRFDKCHACCHDIVCTTWPCPCP